MTDTSAQPENATPEHQVVETRQGAETGTLPEQEVAELKDRLLRALAEAENTRKRSERAVAEARTYGIVGFARDMLSVADNIRRALDAVAPELRQNADPGIASLLEGVELTERELLKTLERHGVTKLDPQGSRFDPHFHQAMFEVPDPNVLTGTVTQVVQTGRHDRGIDVDLGQLPVGQPCQHLRIGDDLHLCERLRNLPLGAGVNPPPQTAHTIIV